MWAGGGIRGGITAPVNTHKIIVKELDVRGEDIDIPNKSPEALRPQGFKHELCSYYKMHKAIILLSAAQIVLLLLRKQIVS